MTRRERLERKIEKREEWAAGRRSKASKALATTEKYHGDIAFNCRTHAAAEELRDMLGKTHAALCGVIEGVRKTHRLPDPYVPQQIADDARALLDRIKEG